MSEYKRDDPDIQEIEFEKIEPVPVWIYIVAAVVILTACGLMMNAIRNKKTENTHGPIDAYDIDDDYQYIITDNAKSFIVENIAEK